MIVGFAHLAINVNDIELTINELLKKGYQLEKSVTIPNNREKMIFLNEYSEFHSISLLKSSNGIDLELTHHGTCKKQNFSLEYSKRKISIKTEQVDSFEDLLINFLGFHQISDSMFRFSSLFSLWNCEIELIQSSQDKVYLDNLGPTCLAFYSSNLEKDFFAITSSIVPSFATSFFEVNLSDRCMSVVMFQLRDGPIFELIQVKR